MARSGAGWKARRGAEKGAEQILREIGAFMARAKGPAARTHAPRFPEWHIAFRLFVIPLSCGTLRQLPSARVSAPRNGPATGGGLAGRAHLPSAGVQQGTPGPGLQTLPGVSPPDRNPEQGPRRLRGSVPV